MNQSLQRFFKAMDDIRSAFIAERVQGFTFNAKTFPPVSQAEAENRWVQMRRTPEGRRVPSPHMRIWRSILSSPELLKQHQIDPLEIAREWPQLFTAVSLPVPSTEPEAPAAPEAPAEAAPAAPAAAPAEQEAPAAPAPEAPAEAAPAPQPGNEEETEETDETAPPADDVEEHQSGAQLADDLLKG